MVARGVFAGFRPRDLNPDRWQGSIRMGGAAAPTLLVMSLLVLACGTAPGTVVEGEDEGQFAVPAIEWDPERYVAYRTNQQLQVDGELSENAWLAAEWTADFVDIEGSSRPEPRFRTRVKMLWDSACFYVGAEMEEPHVWGTLTERDAVIFNDNDFEVFIDPDGDTHEYYELEINALGTEWDLFLVKPYRDGGPALNSWEIIGLRTAVSVAGTINNPTDIDQGWSVEIAIPWVVLGEAAHKDAPPNAGDQWRVNFSRVEWRAEISGGRYVRIDEPEEGRTRPEDNWVWSPQGLIAMHYPEMWGLVQFSDQLVEQGDDAFAPKAEDDARWFLRQVYYKERSWFSRHGRFIDDAGALGVPASPLGLWLTAGPRLFDAWTLVDGREMHIGEDGRVFFVDPQ